jgi:3-phenylpropionate/cinnamic acid dioxygenase small subunit
MHFEATVFLTTEAARLDDKELTTWLEMLEPDISYRAPLRVTRERQAGAGFVEDSWHFNDDFGTLEARVRRLETAYAWAEDPPTRTRRYVTNVRVAVDREVQDQLHVRSSLLMLRTRLDLPDPQLLSAERRDVLRSRPGNGWGLARRTILLDHTTLPVHNLSQIL